LVQSVGEKVMKVSTNGQKPFGLTSSQRMTPGWKWFAAAIGALWIASIIALSPELRSKLLHLLASMTGQ
jgi:uncharacterized membrane protein YdcZ (DUF606 family)